METSTFTSATQLAQAIRGKQVSAAEAVDACLRRIEQVNPALNAVVQLTAEAARRQARTADEALARGEAVGPLHGVPVTIKDAFETEGIVSTGGTLGRRGYVPREDATVVKRLRGAGAIVLGKTNLPELSLAWESDNLIYGRSNNPYDLARTPGGSSGGEGAIIAAGGSFLGVGSDSGGSIRIPAHYCGIAGIKPTTGRVPLTGHFPPAVGVTASLWQAGPLARFVEDLITALPILAGPDGRDPATVPVPLGDPNAVNIAGLRVAFYDDNGVEAADVDTAAVIRRAAAALADVGASVSEARPVGMERAFDLYFGLFAFDGGEGIERFLASIGTEEIHPLIRKFLDFVKPHAMPSVEFGLLLEEWDRFRARMLAFLEDFDVIVCPASATPAPVHGRSWPDMIHAFNYLELFNLAGWPGVVVRGGTSSNGLPIGVQIVGRPWQEHVALAAARQIETALGGWKPPVL